MIIYHGSNKIVQKPKIIQDGYYKDFGYGFYCTRIEKQAMRWALTKGGQPIVNSYDYLPNNNLKVCVFPEMTDEWLDFIANCRNGRSHDFDIVEGPMADDQVWSHVNDYIEGKISREAFWKLVEFKYPTHQITFCTKAALETITFGGSRKL